MYQVITIDGFASSGKSTLAKAFARKKDFYYLSTADLHRISAFRMVRTGLDYTNPAELERYLSHLEFSHNICEDDKIRFTLNGTTIDDIWNHEIEDTLPHVVKLPEVCAAFTAYLRGIIAPKPIVAEGYGVGVGIFPNAKLKFFCTAPLTVRAARKFQFDSSISQEDMVESVYVQDKSIAGRPINPIRLLEDMVLLNTHENNIALCLSKMDRCYEAEITANYQAHSL